MAKLRESMTVVMASYLSQQTLIGCSQRLRLNRKAQRTRCPQRQSASDMIDDAAENEFDGAALPRAEL
jgi:hypothetical protein